jgi:hypothetical protein
MTKQRDLITDLCQFGILCGAAIAVLHVLGLAW